MSVQSVTLINGNSMRRISQLIIALFPFLLLIVSPINSHAQTSPDMDAVRAANQSYYAALSARDLPAMEKVWAQSPDDVNVAPPAKPVAHVGWPAIKKNYETFWLTSDEFTISMENPPSGSKDRLLGSTAWSRHSDAPKPGKPAAVPTLAPASS